MQIFNDSIFVRKVEDGDEKMLLDFYLSFSEEDAYFFKPWPFTIDAITKHLRDAIEARAVSFIAVNKREKIVGHAFVQYLPAPTSESLRLTNMCPRTLRRLKRMILKACGKDSKPRLGIGVHPSQRRKKLSSFMLDRLIAEARHRHISVITLGVHKANIRAIALYEKMGFVIVRKLSQQTKNDSYEMELTLTPSE